MKLWCAHVKGAYTSIGKREESWTRMKCILRLSAKDLEEMLISNQVFVSQSGLLLNELEFLDNGK